MKEWCVKKEYEEALMKIFDKLPETLKEEILELRENYKNDNDISHNQSLIEGKIKEAIFEKKISVKDAYIVSNANDCYGIWENCVDA